MILPETNPSRGTAVARSRRQVLGAAAGFALGAGLAGTARAQSTPVAGERVIDTIHGPVTIPAAPKRVVAISFITVVAMGELGVLPVGRAQYLPTLPPGHMDLEAVPAVETDAYELDLEKILSLKPDVIVGSDWPNPDEQQAPYKELSAIAPTVLFEWKTAAGNWPAEAAGIADVIGKTAELDKLRAAYEDKASTIRKTYADTLAANTWDIVTATDTNWYLYAPNSSHGEVAKAAGIQFGAAKDQTEGYLELSFEDLGRLKDTSALLLPVDQTYGQQQLEKLQTFQALPAARNKHLYNSDYYFPCSYGIATALLGDIETGLKALQSGS